MTGDPINTFNTDTLFSGGAGLFLQFHDIVKPTYLTAIIKLLLEDKPIGLPVDILRHFSILSLIEWYLKRRHWNPLVSLDYYGRYSQLDLDRMLHDTLLSDTSLYRLSPVLNVGRLLSIYSRQHMTFPVYVYTEEEEPGVESDIIDLFPGVPTTYLHGDLTSALSRCDQNFTYIVADIRLLRELVELLSGTCSHLLVASDYRYNFQPNDQLRYNLLSLMREYPYLRLETTSAVDPNDLALSLRDLSDKFEI